MTIGREGFVKVKWTTSITIPKSFAMFGIARMAIKEKLQGWSLFQH
jgi:hypothetical protein